MKASARALVLVASGVAAFPSYLSCDRPLVVGHVIMGKAAIEESASATAFEGKECGGTYTPGEELTLTVSGGGTYMLEVVGGTLSIAGNKCNSRRYANLGSATASYAMSTSADKSLVEAWIGRGTGPTLADMPVAIYAKCTLTAAPASSTPTPAPSPGTSPTPAPTTSPAESKGGGAPLIVLPSLSSSGLELFVSLTIEQYLLVLPDNLQQYTSGYDGGLTGPTIRVKPGSTLHVKLKNQLRRKTNLHTHGLHVHGRQPGDDVFVGTEPGDSFDYTFEIPSDHMGGTFLYHPHYHGSTAIQAGGGAAGLIIVEDDPNQLPSEIATLPEILTMLSHIDMPHLKSMGIEEEAQCEAKGFSPEECDEPSWSEGPISGTPINYVAVNGMFQPTISMVANRWYRWRMAYMTPLGILRPTIAGCDTKLLAKDGIYLPTAPRDVTIGHMGPGNRADWLVRCPVGTYEFKDQSTRRRLASNQVPFISLMGTIKATDEGFTPCDLPTFEVNRPCYLVDLRDSTPNTTVDFTMGPTPYINGAKFESATTYAATMPVGEVIQFDLAGIVLHPFHNHINSFQIVEEPADTSQGYYRAGDWHDTVVGPDYSMSVRFQTDTFTGPQVFHCHELTHEDRGMIGVTLITGTEPTVWAGAKGVDANCVRGTSTLRAATILTEGTCSAAAGPRSTPKSIALSSTSLCYETDCSFMISFRESPNVPDNMEFTVKHTGEAWLGLGVSPDGRMGSEAISIITTWEGALSASHVYRLEGRTKDEITRGWVGLADVILATREEGVSTIVANVPLSDSCTPGELVICRNRPTTIIAARGYFDYLGVHPGQTRITLDTSSSYIQPRALKWDLLLHVVSMSLAWLFCAPVALFCARARHLNSFKPFLLRTRFKGGRQYWYLAHRNCLITAVTLTTFAGVLMVARTDIHFAVTHSYFGIVTMCLASVQMIDAWLRPKHGHKWRKFWERLHKSLGISVLILAVISGAFGASALQARVNREFLLTSKIDGQLLQPTHSETPQPPPPPKLLPPPAFSPVVVPSPVRKPPPIFSPPPGPPPLGVKAAVQEAARRIEELCLEDLTTGPKFIRLAFRDAGTYDAARDLYGPRASMRFEPEASHPSNRGLDEGRKLLEPIKQAVPVLSYADLWQLAAVVSIEMMGGPRVPFSKAARLEPFISSDGPFDARGPIMVAVCLRIGAGRTDASGPEECAPDGMLPGAHDTAEELRGAFNRMGFNDGELVALMGAHTVGICRVRNSGFRGPWDATSLRFDNLYYREVLKSDRWLYDGSQFNGVNGDGTMLLETDFRMSTDDAFATWTRLFADDELLWFEMFAGAFQKLGELGHASSSLGRVDYTLFSVHAGQLQAAVEHAAQLVQGLVEKHRVGPAFVRLAWQDAGTYNATEGKYGPRASMRFEPEASHPSNRGLERIRSMLEPIKQAVPVLSYADLWQLAAVVSIEMMEVGRIDASSPEECAPDGMLPGAHDTAEELRGVFNRMGFNDGERVALMGAHSLGRCQPQNSGFDGAWTSDPLAFNNQYFKDQFDEQWASAGDIYKNGHQDGTIRLNADMHLSTDPQLVRWATAFASDEALFFSSFTSAFQKMSQLGHTSLRDATFSLSSISPAITNAQGDSVCLNRERGSCIVLLSWTVHPEDDSATAIVKVAHLVGWVALAVSKEGRMTYPEPSYAIVGSDIGVRKHILQAQDVTSLTRSAPLDSEQRVREASFERSNGFATLRFRTNLTWFTRYANATTGELFFMYAHGAPGDLSAGLGYHGKINRGNRQVSAFGVRDVTASLLAQEQVQNATTMIAKLVATRHVGPAFVRLAWQDAGTFDARQNKYGPRASMRFEPEASHPSNRGLHEARKLLEPIKQAVPELSYADLWQLAAVVSIEMMGGPRVPFRVGRIDARGSEECAPDGMLPSAHDTAEELRRAFNRMGFNDEELVALAGARTLGRCHFQNSGFDGAWTSDPLSFDNKFYTTIRANNISYDGEKWMSEHGIMLDADLAFKNDSGFRVYTDRFAESETAFFEAFAKAFSKLSDLGWTDGLSFISYTIPTAPVATDGMSDGSIQEVQLGDSMQLTWSVHEDGNVSVIVKMEESVGWMALGVSESGRMVAPSPSLAVFGSNDGVQMRRLTSQNSLSVAQSFPLDKTQVVHSSSFVRADGKSILQFRTSLSWFEHFADAPNGSVWFIYAHGPLDLPNEQVGYHGLLRGTTLVSGIGRPRALKQPPPPSLPIAQTKSFSPRPDVTLEWTRTGVAVTRVSLRVELRVQWLAFAVSAAGKMITPQPSRAVVGTLFHGVYQRSLVAKDMTAISSSAPIDSVQSLTNPTLTQVDGATILAFTVNHSFLTQFAEDGSAVNFLFAHGEPDSPASTFGYHGPRRGAMLIQDFDTAAISSPLSPPPSPWLPPSAVRVELTPHAGVSLFVALKDFSSVASIKLVVQRQVPWLSVAVSHSGFMTDPNSSKAVVGDVASSSVSEFNLVSQNPAMPSKSVEKPIDKAGFIESSVSFADGVTVLQFDISVAWLTAFGGAGDVWLLWAHGSATLPRRFPSYHAGNRGAVLISHDDLFGEYFPPPSNPAPDNSGGDHPPDSKPPPPPQPPDASSCNCGDEVDWCGETEAYNVAKCYVSDVSLTPTTFSTNHSMDYDHEVLLSSEYRLKWKIHGTYPDGEISIILEARTTGWIGFGLMGDPSADGNGMINSDIYLGAVTDGVADVLDAWSSSVAAPIQDKQFGHTHDIYDIGGFENAERGMTTIWFTRKLVTNDTWDYNIDPGVRVPIIFAYSRKNVDSFSHYHGPTRGFDQIVFIPSVPPHDYSNLVIAAGVAVAMVLFMLTVDYGKRRMQAAATRAARVAVLTKQIDDSVDGAGKFMFGMVLLKASDFLKHGKFVAYEELRDANEVKLLDTIAAARTFAIDKSIIFFSHQWLGWDEPDPNRVHYACMKKAVERVVEESATSLEQTWVWVDYSCMPQLNQTTLGLAVSDLSEVACLATFFVVVAPPTVHQDSRAKCDLISYQARGWCRLEQFSYVCTGKTGSMLVSTGGGEEAFAPYISQPAEWKKQALWVLQGEYTCCSRSKNHTVGDMLCDKDKLKPALLRMYMKAICHLPPCPLREQLLERDFEILDAGSFDDVIVTLARKKFAQMSAMATNLRRLSSSCNFQRTASRPFQNHVAASETAHDTLRDASLNRMPFGHPTETEQPLDVPILHGPLAGSPLQVAESQLRVTSSRLLTSPPQPNGGSSDSTGARAAMEVEKNCSISGALSPCTVSSNSASVVDELRPFPSTESTVRKQTSCSKFEMKRNSCDSTRSFGAEASCSESDSGDARLTAKSPLGVASPSSREVLRRSLAMVVENSTLGELGKVDTSSGSASPTIRRIRGARLVMRLYRPDRARDSGVGALDSPPSPHYDTLSTASPGRIRSSRGEEQDEIRERWLLPTPNASSSRYIMPQFMNDDYSPESGMQLPHFLDRAERPHVHSRRKVWSSPVWDDDSGPDEDSDVAGVSCLNV